MSNTVHVKGISAQTSEKEVRDFFSFCGKISNLTVSSDADSSQSADVTFEKETAAKTALLLDNTQLGSSQVSVTSATSSGQTAAGQTTSSTEESEKSDHLAQEDKPRSRVLAEYLAHGYVISDKAIERGIALDQQHGVSNRFVSALTSFDSKYKVTERSAQMDEKYGVSKTAQQGWLGFASYFEKAANTPTGQKLRSFYEQGQKQVLDVHNEAKHLAALKSGKPEEHLFNPAAAPGAAGSAAATGTTKMPTAEEANMEKVQVDGQEKTKCNCGGVDGVCPCEPGKCACAGCSKAT